MAIVIKPLDPTRKAIRFFQFLSYTFDTNILIPVDTFSFTFKNPTTGGNILNFVQEGDIAELSISLGALDITLTTGIVDVIEIETTADGGEVVVCTGRDLLGQLEDQNVVGVNSQMIWGNSVTVQQAFQLIIANTRIRGVTPQSAPTNKYLLATEAGESKISALQRFIDPLNCIFWQSSDGHVIVGRPNMAQAPLGNIIADRTQINASNVLSIKCIRSATQIPNIVIPVWTGQESIISRVAPEQALYNPAIGPSRLRRANHLVQKAIVVSTSQGASPQDLSSANAFSVAAVGGSNLLQAQAKREMARANISEITVQCNVPGHTNDNLVPFMIDQVYKVQYPSADIDMKMYLYQATYTLAAGQGPRTSLNFTQLGTIVSDIQAT